MGRPFRRATVSTLPVLLALGFSLVFAVNASGASRANVSVRVIEASSSGDRIDPKLSDIKAKLSAQFRFSSYVLKSSRRLSLAQGSAQTVALPESRVLDITYLGDKGGRAEFRVKIMRGNAVTLNTKLTLKNGGEFLTVVSSKGPKSLILTIKASF
ncbi:hypothetical protein ACFL4G_08650 [Thermodesulfobacteriota bacterium]